MNLEKIKPYLPSKNFQKIIGSVVIIIILFFGINLIFANKKTFENKNNLAINQKTIYEIKNTDTDFDGVYDWEEVLWGTDPKNKFTFDGMSDDEYIKNKKLALNTADEPNSRELTETDKFAQEFFASFVSLQANDVDINDINNFADALGQNIANKDNPIVYNLSQVKTSSDTSIENQIKYYESLQNMFNKYQDNGLGDEVEALGQKLLKYTNEDKIEDTNELILQSEAYMSLAKEIMNLSVPSNLATIHLNIVNSTANIGRNVLAMTKVINDPIVGVSALANYQKYTDELEKNVSLLEQELEKML